MASDFQPVAPPLMGSLQPTQSGYVAASRGAKLYYEVYGDGGKTLVFLNGACGKIPLVGHVVQRMVRLGYRVLLHEPRGIGRSTCPPGLQTTRLLAADCLTLVDTVLGADSLFFLMGASMGGMVGQELLYLLVRRKQQSRVLAAFLVVTCGGTRWRPPPFRRAACVRRHDLPQMSYKDQADFDARFPHALGLLFSQGWLDAPAATAASPSPSQAATKTHLSADPAAAAAAARTLLSQAATSAPASTEQPPAVKALTRRQRILELWSSHWRQMSALQVEEMGGVLWHMTAHKSHFLGPRRAAAIKAAGIKIGVGVATGDVVHPPDQQSALAAQLGAEEHVVGVGHCDWCFFEGVSWLAAGALATFGDSRV